MLIKYTPKTKHIKCVPLFTNDGNIKLTRSQVELHPGINEVSEDEWAVMKTVLTGDNEIVVVKTGTTAPSEKPKRVRTLKDVNPGQAVEIVKNCLSGNSLKKWYRNETREIVLLAILKQLKKINVDPFEGSEEEPDMDGDEADTDGENPKNSNDDNKGKEINGKLLDEMTKEELLNFAAKKGITVAGNKESILAALKAVVEHEGGVR